LHRRISDAAGAWEADARDPGGLYRGARLSGALEWRAAHEDQMNDSERAFLAASRSAAERAQRRLRLVLGGVSVLLVAALIAGLVALDQRGNARTKARAAEAQRLGAQALSEKALDRALLLARQALALDDSFATRSTLLSALLRSPAAIHVQRGDGGRMLSVAVAPDGRTVVTGDNNGIVQRYDAATWRRTSVYRSGIAVRTLLFSPDGTRLAIASANEYGGALDLLDALSFQRVSRETFGEGVYPFHAIAFSPDSRILASGYSAWSEQDKRQGPGLLAQWDAHTGRSLSAPRAVAAAGEDFLVAFAGRERRVITSERATYVLDADTWQPLRRLPGGAVASASAVSPDGHLAALAAADGSLRLLDLRSGSSRTLFGRQDAAVQSAVFSADGRRLLTGNDDAQVMVWDVAGARRPVTFEGHSGRINGVALSPDGRTAYTASLDGTVIAWDAEGARSMGHAFQVVPGHDVRTVSETVGQFKTPVSYNISASPDGNTLTVGEGDGHMSLIDARSLDPVARIRVSGPGGLGGVGGLGAAAFSPDGRTFVTADGKGYVTFWDLRTRTRLGRPIKLNAWPLWPPQYSADGRWLAVDGVDSVIWVLDARRRAEVHRLRMAQQTRDMAIRPDGQVLAVPATNGPGQGYVDILAVPSLRRIERIPQRYGRWSRFSADGQVLILGDPEGRAQLYDGHTIEPRGRPLLGHAGFILTEAFSPDGRTVATSSSDGTVRLWDVASGRPIGSPLPGIPNAQVGVVFTRGGTHVAAVYESGQGYSWDVRPGSWAHRACAVAGRRLTRAEWEEALPGRSYEPACPTGP
jgi:WD40 repeat protein